MRVDAHQHYWKLSRGDYAWLKPSSEILYQDYMPEQLKPKLEAGSIDKTIVVQAAGTLAETEFLLALCEQEPTMAGVVGWMDLESEDFEQQLINLKKNKYFVGIRPSFTDMEQAATAIPARVIHSLQLMNQYDVSLDLLVRPHQLPYVLRLLHQLPNLKAVINHLANPKYIDAQHSESMLLWKSHMQEIAQFPNMCCKLSGMVNHIQDRPWTPDDFRAHVHHVVDVFGPSRVMFGSDWPVCLLAAQYNETLHLLEATLPAKLSEKEREQIFGHNAISFYGITLDGSNNS